MVEIIIKLFAGENEQQGKQQLKALICHFGLLPD